MARKFSVLVLAVLMVAVVAYVAAAKTGTKADLRDAGRAALVESFHVQGVNDFRTLYNDGDPQGTGTMVAPSGSRRHAVGTALAPPPGKGDSPLHPGTSVDVTYNDGQTFYVRGRAVSHYYNGEVGENAEVTVHFVYDVSNDTLPFGLDGAEGVLPRSLSGYNIYDAVNADWPRGQDAGCELQSLDPNSTGKEAAMAMREDGLAVFVADSRYFKSLGGDPDTLANGEVFEDHMFFYQGAQYGCTFPPGTLTDRIDSSVYQTYWADLEDGDHARYPQIDVQWDGTQNIYHSLISEENAIYFPESDPNYAGGTEFDYRVFVYFRKVGDAGSWTSGQIIDTIERNFADLHASRYGAGVVIAYTNPSYWGRQLNQAWDKDMYYRESPNYGATWNNKVNVTNHQNAILGDPNHFTIYYECRALYSSDGNLHILYQRRPSSADPYFDGYTWADFDEDLAHWDRNSDERVRVASANFYNADQLTGSINTLHCGFGGDPAGYLQFFNLSECDSKLYAVWGQIHVWGKEGDYDNDPTLLEDCVNAGSDRLYMANWEQMMSVAPIGSANLWDPPRHITNTYTPNCGLPGDPEADGECGNEYKMRVETFGFDEGGLGLTWPNDALIDLTPTSEGSYTGDYFLNAWYVDDIHPGKNFAWTDTEREPNGINHLAHVRWVRLACVEPVQASLIEASPRSIEFPEWVQTGTVGSFPVTVYNNGNVTLNVNTIGAGETTPTTGWLSSDEASLAISAGLSNTGTFNILCDATGITVPTWLEGVIYLKSDAQNTDSLNVGIRVLAAPHVESVVWDTVFTHPEMYDPYGVTEGECIGLAVGNHGELGFSGNGNVNLDYAEAGDLECGPRDRDAMYLISGSAYVLDADGGGLNVLGSSSFNDLNQADEYSFDPYLEGTLGGVTGGSNSTYDSAYTGRFVNRDTTVAMERSVYAPRDDYNNQSFMISILKVYSADGAAHSNITVGNLSDWDIPAEEVPNNTSGVSTTGNFTYMQGTDTTGVYSCKSHTTQFGTEAFGGWWSFGDSPCDFATDYYGAYSAFQPIIEDTNLTRTSVTLDPPMPDFQAWWDDLGANPGNNGYTTAEDQCVFLTFKHNFTLGATDTLYFWTVYSTVLEGTLADLESHVAYAKTWAYTNVIEPRCGTPSCCQGRVGDANASGDDEPTLGDISAIIAALFIQGIPDPIDECFAEADVNQSGGLAPTYDDITLGDIGILISYLFIKGPYDAGTNPSGEILPNCL